MHFKKTDKSMLDARGLGENEPFWLEELWRPVWDLSYKHMCPWVRSSGVCRGGDSVLWGKRALSLHRFLNAVPHSEVTSHFGIISREGEQGRLRQWSWLGCNRSVIGVLVLLRRQRENLLEKNWQILYLCPRTVWWNSNELQKELSGFLIWTAAF